MTTDDAQIERHPFDQILEDFKYKNCTFTNAQRTLSRIRGYLRRHPWPEHVDINQVIEDLADCIGGAVSNLYERIESYGRIQGSYAICDANDKACDLYKALLKFPVREELALRLGRLMREAADFRLAYQENPRVWDFELAAETYRFLQARFPTTTFCFLCDDILMYKLDAQPLEPKTLQDTVTLLESMRTLNAKVFSSEIGCLYGYEQEFLTTRQKTIEALLLQDPLPEVTLRSELAAWLNEWQLVVMPDEDWEEWSEVLKVANSLLERLTPWLTQEEQIAMLTVLRSFEAHHGEIQSGTRPN